MSFIRLSFFATVLLTLSSSSALALDIWPLNPSLELKPMTKSVGSQVSSALLFLDNGAVSTQRYQVRVFRWSQVNNQDIYQEQSEIQPQPPIVDFTSAGKQVIRLLNTYQDESSNIERTYRVIIDEIPGSESDKQSGVKFRLRLVVPFFVYPSSIDKKFIPGVSGIPEKLPPASWKIIQLKGQSFLEIKNNGKVHLRLADMFLSRKGTPTPIIKLNSALLGYVLPGQSMQFPLKNRHIESTKDLVLYSTYGKNSFKVIGNE